LQTDDAITEPDFPVYKDADLQCTRSGQVLEDFKGKSVFHFNLEAARELANLRKSQPPGTPPGFHTLLGCPETIPAARVKEGKYPSNEFLLETEPGIVIPVTMHAAGGQPAGEIVLYLNGEGRGAGTELIGALAKQGKTVIAADLRGIGQTAPATAAKGWSANFGVEWKEGFLGLHLNRPLLGQRVYDVLSVVRFLAESQPSKARFGIVGVGSAGPIALHAAALEPRIEAVTLDKSLVSWMSVVETPLALNQFCNIVPGALKVYDLPDLAAALAPRPLTIRNVVDARQQPVAQAELERVYRACRESYARQGAEGKLVLESR
jgi:hypothetical protein